MSETEDYEKQRLATLKRLKQCDENELNRKTRLEKVVASIQFRLAVETEDERRAKPENNAATKWLRFRKSRLEKIVTTTQLRLALETEEERRPKKKKE